MQPRSGSRRRLVSRLLLATAVVITGSLVSVLASARTSAPSDGAPARAVAGQADPAPVARAAQSRRRAVRRTYNYATTSSPIARSRAGGLVWTVNPSNDTVSVIRTGRTRVIRRISVGDEPRSIALDPNNPYAFVANAAGGSVTVIQITNPNPGNFARASVADAARPAPSRGTSSPRPTAAASSWPTARQDTITRDQRRHAARSSATSICATAAATIPTATRHFQPRGLAVTAEQQPPLRDRASCPSPGRAGDRASTTARRAWSAGSNINTESRDIDDYVPRKRITLAPQVTGFRVDSTGDGAARRHARLSQPAAEHRHPRQHGLPAEHRRLARRPAALQRRHARVRQRHERRAQRHDRDASSSRFLNLHLGAREPEPGKKKLFFANPWAMAFTSPARLGQRLRRRRPAATCWSSSTSRPPAISLHGRRRTRRATSTSTTRPTPPRAATTRARTRRASSSSRDGTARVRHELRLAQRVRGRPRQRPRHRGRSARRRCRRPARRRRSPASARRCSSPRGATSTDPRTDGLHDRAPFAGGLAELRELPLQGPDGRRGLAVRLRPAQVACRSTRPSTRATAAEQRLLNYSAIFDEVEDFEAQHPQRLGPRPARGGAELQQPAAGARARSTRRTA